MTRNVRKIKKKELNEDSISFIILSAGCGKKIKSYEPRSLLKNKDGQTIIDSQISNVVNTFKNSEVIAVIGCHANKIIKKQKQNKDVRFVENQLYASTNSSESLRLGLNNCSSNHVMFCHGDILFNDKTLDNSYSKSFIIVDSNQRINKEEIGVTRIKGLASILSYGLNLKWAQIAFFTGRELRMLNSIMCKFEERDKKKLSFEIINEIISMGGKFLCLEPDDMQVKEIDRIKDME
jgi:choline kinase